MADEPEKKKELPPPEDMAVWRLNAEDRKRLRLAYSNQLRASNWLLFKALVVGTLIGSAYYGFILKGVGYPTPIFVTASVTLVLVMIYREYKANKHVTPLGMAGEMAIMTNGLELRGPDGLVWEHKPTPNVRTYWKVLRIHHATTEFLFNEVWAGDGSAYETSRPVLIPIPEGVDLQVAIELLNVYNEKALARSQG